MWYLQKFALICFLKKWSWREIAEPFNSLILKISKFVLCVCSNFIWYS